jgi:hypothetical protein
MSEDLEKRKAEAPPSLLETGMVYPDQRLNISPGRGELVHGDPKLLRRSRTDSNKETRLGPDLLAFG